MPKQKCPKCGSKEGVPIVYGLPSEKTFEMKDRGEIVLGGCCVGTEVDGKGRVVGGSPKWHCKKCRHEWGITVL